MASVSLHPDEEDFDWEAAVREIDSACQSTIPSSTNGGAPSTSVAIGGGACPRSAAPTGRARQSTIDRYVDRFGTEKGKACLQGIEAGGCWDRDDAIVSGDGAPAVSIDLEAAKTWIYPINIPLREYQFAIAKNALFSNTLVALPTGLGKTLIAAVVMYNYFRWFPKGKIVFAAPSRPLVMQQIEACHNIVGIPQEWTIDMTGQMSPLKRSRFWMAKRVFFVTPQVFEKDIQSGICLVRQLVCLVFDEAHRAIGNYSYCVAVRELMAIPVQLRILALTATPGSKHQTIQHVIDNLRISTLEYRHESDRDVSSYVHGRKLELIEVSMGKDAVGINSLLLQAIQPFISRLSAIGALPHRDFSTLSPSELLNLRDKFRQAPPHNLPQSKYGEIEMLFCALITFYHLRKLLSSHGIRPAYEMLQEKLNQGSFSKLVSKIEAFWKAKNLMQQSLSHGAPTPKMVKLLEILVDHFKTKNPNDSRVIIFSNFRGSVRDIMNYLSSLGDMIKATEFIGQSSGKSLKGQTQKMQQAVLEKFRSGGYNVIVATSIGEEGLDIMEVDLVICFDANVSPLRMIQRMGRTGRKNDGRVVILACEGSELKAYLKKQASTKAMRKHLNNGGIKSFNFYPSPRMVPHVCKPEVQYLEMSIEQFIPRRKKAKILTNDGSPVSRNISDDERNLISKYFPYSREVAWKPSLIAFPSFQRFPSRVSRVRHSFKTTSMFIDAMQDLQGLSFSKVNNDDYIEIEVLNQPHNECIEPVFHGIVEDDGAPFQVSTIEDSNVQITSHIPHNEIHMPKPHCFLFNEGSVTVNSSGNVLIMYVPIIRHKESKSSENTPIGKPASSLRIQAFQNEQENVKCAIRSPDFKLNHQEFDVPATRINCDNENVLRTPVGRSRIEANDIKLSPRLTHFIEEGIVPESPVLDTNHCVPMDEKRCFLSGSLKDDEDSQDHDQMHVNKLSCDELVSPSQNQFVDLPCGVGITGLPSKETKRAKNAMVEYADNTNTAYAMNEEVRSPTNIINEAAHTPNTANRSSSEDWKCKSGDASISLFRARKYKRLRKHGDVVRKLPTKSSDKRLKFVERNNGGSMKTRENKSRHPNGEKDEAIRPAEGFIDEEAEVSGDASISDDEEGDEMNDRYDDSFIDDGVNPTEGSMQAENNEVDMIGFYRRSLLSQSPMVPFTGNCLPASNESLSSATAGSCSPILKHSHMETPQNALFSVNQINDKNYSNDNCESGNHSDRFSIKLESRKRRLIFQPSNSRPHHNESNMHNSPKIIKFDSCILNDDDDDFYRGLDLDEVEAQATEILRCRSDLSIRKSQTLVGDRAVKINKGTSNEMNFVCSPSFDLGI